MSSSSILSFWKIIVGRDARRPTRSLPCISFHLNAARRPARFAHACPQSQRTRFSSANRRPENPEKGGRRPARFAHTSPQSQRLRFSSANRGPRNPEKGARRPAQFAHACPQNQRTRFSSANRGPRNPKEGARRPARFAPVCPQSQRIRFSSANPGDAQNSKTHPARRRSPPGPPAGPPTSAEPHRDRRPGPPTLADPHRDRRPAHFGGARRPGSAPVKRCPKVKFKLTIQSENLRLNSKCFYHYKTD